VDEEVNRDKNGEACDTSKVSEFCPELNSYFVFQCNKIFFA